jgi:hypothetical protein
MAVKSQTITPAKNEGPVEPMKKTQTVNTPAKPAILLVAINGSWTFHSMKYMGVVEWPENDDRLVHAKGHYTIVGRK